jgi:N utilization substance protein B
MNAPARQARSVARLAAVQALYQMEVSSVGAEAVIREFGDHRFDRQVDASEAKAPDAKDQNAKDRNAKDRDARERAVKDDDAEDLTLAAADEEFFADVVRGVVAKQRQIDQAVVKRLAQNWKLERIDATVRAILRAGAYELSHRPDVPTEVVIDEYVELAKSFFDGPEPGFVNGALDGVARDVRR